MGTLSMRELLPTRRNNWTQHVHIGGQSVYLTVGEYADGRPGEIFIDVARAGAVMREVMSAVARTVSIALQCGAGIEVIIGTLRKLDYEPSGPVSGSENVQECTSVMDWIASELEAAYTAPQMDEVVLVPESTRRVAKAAGHLSESWRTGI